MTSEEELSENINEVSNLITQLYQAAENEILLPFSVIDDFNSSSLDDYPFIQKQMDKVIKKLSESAILAITNSIKKSWDLSNRKNDKLVSAYFKGWKGTDTEELKNRYLNENLAVRNAFLSRKTNGLNLSERVWNYNGGYKNEIEDALQIGISNGVAAKKMAKLLKDYLRNPATTILEVDNAGVANKLIGQNKTGQGVYRDPLKNALRLARTETNIAYRTADTTRWSQLDFIVGYEVHLSKNHTTKIKGKAIELHDICDELAGKYPKDFKFVGWHPHCRCYITSILKTEKEMDRDEKLMRQGKEPSPKSVNTVSGTPPQLGEWIKNNTVRLESSNSLPYFVRDNASFFKGVNFSDAVKKQFLESAEMKRAQVLQNAKIRHNARTSEQIADIKARWAARQIDINRKAVLAAAETRHAMRTPEQIADIKARWAAREKEMRRKAILAKAEARHNARTKAEINSIKKMWEERKERIFTTELGKNYLSVAQNFKFDSKLLSKLESAITKRNVTSINKAIEDIKSVKNSVKKLPHVSISDFKTYTFDELQSFSTSIQSKLQSLSHLPLDQQKTKLEFEINYIIKNPKYSTSPLAIKEYKAALADVEYKIRIDEYSHILIDFKKSGISSKKYNAALKKAEKAFNGGKLAASDEADFKKLLAVVEKEKQAYITDFVAKNEYIKSADFAQFTVTELEQAQTAVASKIKSLSALPLDQQKTKLEFEIGWVQKNKKYSTWSISERAYKEQLVAVEYKIRINEYTDHLANLTSFSTADATYQKALQKASAILSKPQLTAADEDVLKTLLSDLDKQKKVLSGGKALTPIEQLQEDIDARMAKLHGIYSKAVTNKYGNADWLPADQTLQDMQRKLKKMIEDEAYANYKTDPPTAPIKKYTKAQISAAEKTWAKAHFSLPYVQGTYGGTFTGGTSFYTGKFWDAITADKAFATKLQRYGIDVTWEELNVISTYAYKSGFINKYLLGLGTPSAAGKKYLDAFCTVLDNTLTKMPKYKGVTYRGACISKSNMANDGMWKTIMDAWNKGGVWESKTPMSSTANVDTSEYFAGGVTANHIMQWDRQRVLFKIKSKTGVSISEIAGDPKQDEVLFRSGSKFKIVKKPYQVTSKNADFGAVGDYIVELEEI